MFARRQDKASDNFAEDTEKASFQHESLSEAVDNRPTTHGEVGQEQYLQFVAEGVEISPEDNKAARKRIDMFILPIFFVTQTLQFMDKTALNYANLFGFKQAVNINSAQYSLVAAIFYVGYALSQQPAGILLGKYSAGKVLGISCVFWGISVLLTAACRNYAGALVVRFFLGAFEAPVTPGLSLLTGMWYVRQEIPFRQVIWYSALGVGGIIGGFMATGVATLEDKPGAMRWQIIFYILGGVTIAWGGVMYYFLEDTPSSARFLSPHLKQIAVARVAANSVGVKNTKFEWSQFRAAMLDPKTWLLAIATFATSIPTGIQSNFSTIIIRDLGFTSIQTTLLDTARQAFQILGVVSAGYVATKVKDSRIIVTTVGNLICVVASALLSYLPRHLVWGRFISLCFCNLQSVGFVLGLVMVSSNIGNYSKKQTTSGVIFIMYCAGNIVGPFLVFAKEAPNYPSATIAMLIGYSTKTICHILLGIYMLMVNRSRDRQHPRDEKAAARLGMEGLNENQNPHFRYVL